MGKLLCCHSSCILALLLLLPQLLQRPVLIAANGWNPA
jgi:hypothetical protein